jgi:hypothetical protein
MQSMAVNSKAKRGLNQFDVPEPPASVKSDKVYLHSAFYAGESSVGMPYLVDTHPAVAGAQQWNLIVKTNAVNSSVTVNWPSLQGLPANLIATMVDSVTGEKRYMRTTNGYTFRTGAAAEDRLLKIVVQPRPSQSLALTSVQACQTALGGAITYTLSADAAVDIRIRNISGVVVSELASGRSATAGTNTALWNGRNTRGSLVPNGRYLCEIVACSPETGQAVSAVHPLDYRR